MRCWILCKIQSVDLNKEKRNNFMGLWYCPGNYDGPDMMPFTHTQVWRNPCRCTLNLTPTLAPTGLDDTVCHRRVCLCEECHVWSIIGNRLGNIIYTYAVPFEVILSCFFNVSSISSMYFCSSDLALQTQQQVITRIISGKLPAIAITAKLIHLLNDIL